MYGSCELSSSAFKVAIHVQYHGQYMYYICNLTYQVMVVVAIKCTTELQIAL